MDGSRKKRCDQVETMGSLTNKTEFRPLVVETMMEGQEFRLPSVDRAMSLFELLANAQRGMTLSELSRKLGIPKSTAHYLIHTLVTRGYIQRGTDGRHYVLGLRFSDVASASPAELNLRTIVTPFLRKLATRLNLTSTATVLRGAEGVIIARIESLHDTGGGAWIGRHVDLHCTAQGKALISTLTEEHLDRLFAGRELAQYTSKTISSLAALKSHLVQVRANGFALNDEEQVLGLRAIAVPIIDRIGAVVASVSVRGSTAQIPINRVSQIARDVVLVTRDLFEQLSGGQ
jgi:DNA-binding IclR family transcriptional regulator